jgi:hypothetical protein
VNYLCHARNHLDRPWALVGTALPDWLRIVDRRIRLRPGTLPAPGEADGSPRDEILRGVRRHFEDNAWFHATPAFRETTRLLAERIRERHPDRPGNPGRRMRAGLFAHLLVEMLLDAWLAEDRPETPEGFRKALRSLEPGRIAGEVAGMIPVDEVKLSSLVARFRNGRFLSGYADDAEVAARLDAVGRRVRQPPLPPGFVSIVRWARGLVREAGPDLLSPPDDLSAWAGERSPRPPASPTPGA